MILRRWGHRDLLVTHNLSEGKTHEPRPYLRGSVRRASGFVLTSKQEVIAMIDCSAVSTRVSRKLARRFRSVQAIFSAHKKAHKTLDLECLSMTYGVVRAFQVIVNTLLCSPEKAGVGGSTPSLATIILNNLVAQTRNSPPTIPPTILIELVP